MEKLLSLLSGRWQQLVGYFWYLCSALAVAIFLLSIPAYFMTPVELRHGVEGVADVIPLLNLLTVVMFMAYSVTPLISIGLAVVLFVKRRNDRMAIFLSFFLLVYGVVMGGPLLFLEAFWPGVLEFAYSVIQNAVFAPLFVLFLTIFPGGSLRPPWTKWLVAATLLYGLISAILIDADVFSTPNLLFVFGVLFWFGLFFVGLYAQILRYRQYSNPTEKQQTKWVVYGVSLAIFVVFLLSLGTLVEQSFPAGTQFPWWVSFFSLGWPLAIAILPVTLTFAVMRYRLYDIDIIINRTLVYGALTASVVGIYVLLVGGIGTALQDDSSQFLSFCAAGIIAVLFQPLREWLQRAVNKLMYGDRDEPFEALAKLGSRLEEMLSPAMVYETIVETAAQAAKLPYVAITIKRQDGFELIKEIGRANQSSVEFPLMYQGQTVGQLLVTHRSPNERFSAADERWLRNFARQASAAVHALRLTNDLQRSRQQLVTAREEERMRLRRDLHDGLGPVLAAIAWQTESAIDLISSNPQEAAQLLEQGVIQVQEALADLRRLVYGLRPPALDELGLVGALEHAARQHHQMTVTIDAPFPLPALPAAVEVGTYRIVHEALKNAVEHGKAANCVVTLALNGDFSLKVHDDGRGLPETISPGVGLVSMRERAEELGGAFVIHASQTGGTEIEVNLPLS